MTKNTEVRRINKRAPQSKRPDQTAKETSTLKRGEEVTELPLDKIIPFSKQPRSFFDEESLTELAAGIAKYGMINPITVRKDGDMFVIVAGERRYRAAKLLGWLTIPVRLTEHRHETIALIENLHREDLTALELAEACAQLVQEQGITQDVLAQDLGKAKSTMSEILSVNRLTEEIKAEVREDRSWTRERLLQVAKLPPEEQAAAFARLKKNLGQKDRNIASHKNDDLHNRITSQVKSLINNITRLIKSGEEIPQNLRAEIDKLLQVIPKS